MINSEVKIKVIKKNTEFTEKIEKISNIQLNIGNYFMGFVDYNVKLDEKESYLEVIIFKKIKSYKIDRDEFLTDLKEIYIDEWKQSYIEKNDIRDDVLQWHLDIKYNNGEIIYYGGVGYYPDNFEEFLKCIKKWIPKEDDKKIYIRDNIIILK